jgi:hypothetical protein
LILAGALLFFSCTGAGPSDPSVQRSAVVDQAGGSSFDEVAARLADRGIILRPIPPGRGSLPAARFRRRIESSFADFEVLSIHRALVDIPNDLISWSRQPAYVVEMVGRGSDCFRFFDTRSGKELLGAC